MNGSEKVVLRPMRVDIRDSGALRAISPAVLSAYARSAGWRKIEDYRAHSDVYAAEEMPEVILPRTTRLGDYASVVSRLITIFAEAAGRDELSLYRDLVTADRDVIRVQVTEAGGVNVTLNHAVDLVSGTRDLVLAAACSLREPRPLYRPGASREAAELLEGIRLGQTETEHGSFVVTLLTPVMSPPPSTLFEDHDDSEAPVERRMTRRLSEALAATRDATERATACDGTAFAESVGKGVSANLCDALIKLIGPFPTLELSVAWALTRPVGPPRREFRFGKADAAVLDEAARRLRNRVPQPDARLFGTVHRLMRDEDETSGAIHVRTWIDGKKRSVAVVLGKAEYDRAVQARRERMPVILQGDLERSGRRWRLLDARIDAIIDDEQPSEGGDQ